MHRGQEDIDVLIAASTWLQELVNRWSEQIYGAHRDERETADLRERHAQMQEARSARKRAEQNASAAAEGADRPVSDLR